MNRGLVIGIWAIALVAYGLMMILSSSKDDLSIPSPAQPTQDLSPGILPSDSTQATAPLN